MKPAFLSRRYRYVLMVLGLMPGLQAAPTPFPLLDGLGHHHRQVTQASPQAQRYFDQGMALFYGFSHGGAIKSLREAEKSSPDCALVHWAIALCYGSNINDPMHGSAVAPAWHELQEAVRTSATAGPVEQALIHALSARYQEHPPADRTPLDVAYADAMRSVWKRYPKDADVGVLFADALMNLRPWNQWTLDGKPQPGTEEVISTLDAVLALDRWHPYANHLYIHALEASSHPERAIPAADRLLHLQPLIAHEDHMPSHIYIRVGRWQDAIAANETAIAAQHRYAALVGPPPGDLSIYNAHNEHMLGYAAMMTGEGALAVRHMKAAYDDLAPQVSEDYPDVVDYFAAMSVEVRVRFGRWNDLLAVPPYPATLPFSEAYRHAARAVAFAAKGNNPAARAEQTTYLTQAKPLSNGSHLFGLNRLAGVLAIVTPMLEGELDVREGKLETGLASLRAAVGAQDQLAYDEPPGWLIPARHSLGAALVSAGRLSEAEKVYREDLAHLPNNGWSLYGLSQTLRLEGRNAEAVQVDQRFHRAWAKTDIEIDRSCLCQSPVKAGGEN
jgi:tetratricopeptide (TPR) repeat protein